MRRRKYITYDVNYNIESMLVPKVHGQRSVKAASLATYIIRSARRRGSSSLVVIARRVGMTAVLFNARLNGRAQQLRAAPPP